MASIRGTDMQLSVASSRGVPQPRGHVAAAAQPRLGGVRPYRTASVFQLAELIVEESDQEALDEFHQYRPIFWHNGAQGLRLAEFLDQLRLDARERQWAGGKESALSGAYDLTLDKFGNLPCRDGVASADQPGRRRKDGPDCRRYFGAFLECARRRLATARVGGEIEHELAAAVLLQRLVHKHFRLSCLECHRQSQGSARRYAWRVAGGTLNLWMPVDFSGKRCRSWLAENIDDVNAARPFERDRVQGIVDARLGWRRLLSLSVFDEAAVPPTVSAHQASALCAGRGWQLADVVAREKAARLAFQRPTIRALGGAKLIGLIRRIFSDLEAGTYRDNAVARAFGLSKATLSRFAGSQWPKNSDNGRAAAIPDLWRNTAGVIAAHPDFVDAAEAAGVWPLVAAIARRSPSARADRHG